MKKIILSIVLSLSMFSCTQQIEDNSSQYISLQESEELFQRALTVDEPERSELFFQSASILEEFINEEKIENGYIYYNAGNSWINSGRIGKAILSYKKAAEILPNNKNIRNNLNYTRSKVLYKIDDKKNNPLIQTLFFVHYDLSFQNRFILLITLTFIVFSLASILLIKKNKILRNLLIIFSICTVFLGFSIVLDISAKTEGVVTTKEVIARKGDSEGYENSFTQPLTEGVEFRLLARRNEWYFIKIGDGRTCWIPEYSAELQD